MNSAYIVTLSTRGGDCRFSRVRIVFEGGIKPRDDADESDVEVVRSAVEYMLPVRMRIKNVVLEEAA